MISTRLANIRVLKDDGLPSVVLQLGDNLLLEVFWWFLGFLSLAAVGNAKSLSKELEPSI
jgi:hypothetical protein